MLAVRRVRPSPPLAPFIQAYEERVSRVPEELIVRPLPARTDQFIEFFLGDLYRIRRPDGVISKTPRIVAVGMQTRRGVDILMSGNLHMFAIKFTPTGFHALFDTPQRLLTDFAAPAEDVASRDLPELADALAESANMGRRVELAETWLMGRVKRQDLAPDPIVWAARVMAQRHGQIRIDDLVRHTSLGFRQFERRFHTQVGTGPKRYARILRFQQALALRENCRQLTWTEIAHAAGFSDQAHMTHEFRSLSGEGPKSWMTTIAPAREMLLANDVGNLQL